jgi:hypothetical protein
MLCDMTVLCSVCVTTVDDKNIKVCFFIIIIVTNIQIHVVTKGTNIII